MKIPLSWFDVVVQLIETPDRRMRMRNPEELVILSPSGLTAVLFVGLRLWPDARRGQADWSVTNICRRYDPVTPAVTIP